MANIFIVHGAFGSPKENWFSWLKKELEDLGYRVFVPRFPTPKKQSLKNWLSIFKKYEKYIDKKTIFIGHSIGCAFLLNVLEQQDKKVNASFLVSGFIGLLGSKKFDNLNKTFADKSFDWKKIKKNCKRFYVFHSDNDPYVPIKKAKDLAKKLKAKLIVVKNAGHFNEKSGYKKFELLLKKLRLEFN